MLLFVLLTLTAWAAAPTSLPSPAAHDSTLRIRLPFEPATLDWNLGDVPITVVQNLMRGLYRVDANGKVVHDLVEDETTLDQGLRWRFRLKPGITWSDGTPLNSEHVAASLRRLLHPTTASGYAHILFDVRGALELQRGGTVAGLGIRTPDARRVEIRLERPVPFLPAILTHWVTFPIRPDLIAKHADHWTNPAHLATLGAFRLTEWKPTERVSMVPRVALHGIDRVEALVVQDDATALNLYDTGRLDFMTDPGVGAAARPELTHQPSPITYFIGVGRGHPLTSKRAGVNALSAALNRAELAKALGAPHRASTRYCPPEMLALLGAAPPAVSAEAPREEPLPEGEPRRARGFLKDAGFASGKTVPPLTLRFFNRPAMRELAEWLQEQWRRNLDLKVTLDARDPKVYWTQLTAEPAALFLNSKGPTYPDPDAYFRLFATGTTQNLGRWSDREYDEWTEEAARAPKPERRAELYAMAARRLQFEHPALIPLYFRSMQYLIRPTLKGVVINPLTSVDLSSASLEH